MHPVVYKKFENIIHALKPKGRFLELGAVPDNRSLLSIPCLKSEERVGVNLIGPSIYDGFHIIKANANDLSVFEDGEFDCVLSNAMLEHDRFFWKTISEMRRVLRVGGLAVLGAPGFSDDGDIAAFGIGAGWPPGDDHDYYNATLTFRVHGVPADYYRFSKTAFIEVFFEGFVEISVEPIMVPPRIIGYGWNKSKLA